MTTIDDIQDLVQIIEDRPEWRRELQRVLLTPDLHGTVSLITETANLAAKNAESIAANAESIDRLETLVTKNAESIDELKSLVAENSKGIAELKEVAKETSKVVAENSNFIRINSGHIGDMRDFSPHRKSCVRRRLLRIGWD